MLINYSDKHVNPLIPKLGIIVYVLVGAPNDLLLDTMGAQYHDANSYAG